MNIRETHELTGKILAIEHDVESLSFDIEKLKSEYPNLEAVLTFRIGVKGTERQIRASKSEVAAILETRLAEKKKELREITWQFEKNKLYSHSTP